MSKKRKNSHKSQPSKGNQPSWKRLYLIAMLAALHKVPGKRMSNAAMSDEIRDIIMCLPGRETSDPELPDSWWSIIGAAAAASGVTANDYENLIFAGKYNDKTGYMFGFADMPDVDTPKENAKERKYNRLRLDKQYYQRVQALIKEGNALRKESSTFAKTFNKSAPVF